MWRVTRGKRMTTTDLDELVEVIAATLLPGAEYRHERRVHPYTLDGRQIDVARDGAWLEVAECGLAHPRVRCPAPASATSGAASRSAADSTGC
ncbi:hypothetical protein [Amycolatopsis sp. FDAARGOS 1241]|uniref:tRNA ligase subunit PheS family protein n=1 Tax=Amycolatopsis sp. FDAARGOS 1241 TaxID=2778070 RepID=UPI002106F588|nr:hypothetical protein [Amycolatopsis sp. FDAARGOS 1241]